MARSFAVMIFVLAVAGCGGPAFRPTVSPGTDTAVSSSPTSLPIPAESHPPGALACRLLAKAVDDGTLMQPGIANAIAAASGSAAPRVSAAGAALAAAYAVAVSSHGTDDEPDAVAGVSAKGAEMTRVCAAAGLDTAG